MRTRCFDNHLYRNNLGFQNLALIPLCDAPKSVLCRFKRSRQNPHNNDFRSPTRHNVHAETCALCGWNCDNITIVHEKNPQQQQKEIYIQERLKRVKKQLIHYKDPNHNGSKLVSDYGQDTNWTKSPEDNHGVHIPAQAEPEGYPS